MLIGRAIPPMTVGLWASDLFFYVVFDKYYCFQGNCGLPLPIVVLYKASGVMD
jgi:hypothetical protein